MNKILTILIVAGLAWTALWEINKANYIIVNSGESYIMCNTATGEAWILESKSLSQPLSTSLERDGDFLSPKGVCYYWVPTAVIPCYKEALGVGRTPEEAKEADSKALSVWLKTKLWQ